MSPVTPPLKATEHAFIGLLSAMLVGLIGFLIWDAHQQTPAGWEFLGFAGSIFNGDQHSYLAWIRQAQDGAWLSRDLFTSEPHQAAFFHPLFWAIGVASRLTGLDAMVVWHGLLLFAAVLLVVVSYRFACHFSADPMTRMLATLLASTGGGLGWLFGDPAGGGILWQPVDLWMPEANSFVALTSSFVTLTLALSLMLLAMLRALRYFDTGELKHAQWGGLWALLLASIHLYDIVILFPVLGLWALTFGPKRRLGAIVMGLWVLPWGLYSTAVVTLNPAFSQVNWSMEMPALSALVLGFGLFLPLAGAGLVTPAVWREQRHVLLLLLWLLAVPILLLLPLGFERKLLWGAHIPMAVLGAMALRHWAGRIAINAPLRITANLGVMLVIALLAVGSVQHYQRLLANNAEQTFDPYLPSGYMNAMTWLEEHTEPADVILASKLLANIIPGQTGHTVFMGHWAQTIDARAKRRFLEDLLDPTKSNDTEAILRVLQRNRVRYLVDDRYLAQEQKRSWRPLADGIKQFGRVVFRNRMVAVVELDGYRAQSATQAWPDGDWRG